MKYSNTGSSPIKICKRCGVTLIIGVNCTAAKFKRWDYICSKCSTYRTLKHHTLQRVKVLNKLGGKCAWPGCDITDKRMLQIDHIHGGGRQEAASGIRPYNRYSEIIRMSKEEMNAKYQLLCANHNLLKKHLNEEGISAEMVKFLL